MSGEALRWYWQGLERIEPSDGVSVASQRHALLIISLRALAEDDHTASLTGTKLAGLMGVHRNQAARILRALEAGGHIVTSGGSISVCPAVGKVHTDGAHNDTSSDQAVHTGGALEGDKVHTGGALDAHSVCTHLNISNNNKTTKSAQARARTREAVSPKIFRDLVEQWQAIIGYSVQIQGKAERDIQTALRSMSLDAVRYSVESLTQYKRDNPGVRLKPSFLMDRAKLYKPDQKHTPIERAHTETDQPHVQRLQKLIAQSGGELVAGGGNR